jgi:hypothetical protein
VFLTVVQLDNSNVSSLAACEKGSGLTLGGGSGFCLNANATTLEKSFVCMHFKVPLLLAMCVL